MSSLTAMDLVTHTRHCIAELSSLALAANTSEDERRQAAKLLDKLRDRLDPAGRTIPPPLEDVEQYIEEMEYTVNAGQWWDHYAAAGWYLTKGRKMKDWKAAVRTWQHNSYGNGGRNNGTQSRYDRERRKLERFASRYGETQRTPTVQTDPEPGR